MKAERSELGFTLAPVWVRKKMNGFHPLRSEKVDRYDWQGDIKVGRDRHHRSRRVRKTLVLRAEGRPGEDDRGEILPRMVEIAFIPVPKQLGSQTALPRDWICSMQLEIPRQP